MHHGKEKTPAAPRLVPAPTRNRAHWSLYATLLAAWLFLAALTAAFSINSDLRNARLSFERYADHLYGEISNVAVSNEAALEGMAAFLSVSGANYDSPQFLRHAQQLRARHPHIYMLELVESITHDELPGFVARRKAAGQIEFQIKNFSYDANSAWQPVEEKPKYYPIVFTEPMIPAAKNMLGLDIGSMPFLRQALIVSDNRGHDVASKFFRLVEGDLAYAMIRPVEPPHGIAAKGRDSRRLFTVMVIKSEALIPPGFPDFSGLRVNLYSTGIPSNESGGEFMHLEYGTRNTLETWLFPKLKYHRKLASRTQPFVLQAEQQLGWSDLDLHLLASILVAAVLSFGILRKFVRAHHHSEALRYETETRLAYLANHDSLTGLANRTLFMDRLAHAMARAHRSNTKLGLLFMDLDKFKPVNDTYGHGVGDQLLKVVAERICGCVREDDTVARLSGDEFVVVLESISTRQDAETVTEAIRNNLAQPFLVDGKIALHVGVSIGVAIYPDESMDIDELIKCADHAMYKAKYAAPGPM